MILGAIAIAGIKLLGSGTVGRWEESSVAFALDGFG